MKQQTQYIWNKSLLIVMLISCCSLAFGQNNALVLNGAITVLDGGTSGTPVYLVVNQPNTAGIARLAGGGHIHSENQYNFVKWTSGTSTGNYVFPFGVGANAANYIPFTFNKTTASASNVDLSTWTTNIQNIPHPAATNVAAVTDMTGAADSVLYAVDRFWDIQTSAATTADLTFSYLGTENTTSSPTDTAKAMHWNGSSWDAPVGPGNPGVIAGVGTAGPFLGQATFSPWMLSIISPCPNATISYPSDYCDNDTNIQSITFSGGLGGIFSSNPAGLDLDSLTGAIIPANSTPGTYTVTYTIDSTTVCPLFVTNTTVTIHPTQSVPQNLSICQGDSIFLAGAFQTIAGVYTDSLLNSNNCDSIIITTLTVNPIPVVTTSNDTTICPGNLITISANGATTYTWDNGLGAGQNHNVSPALTTTYIVTGTSNNCSDTASVTVTVQPGTIANAGSDQELCDDILLFTLAANTPTIPGEVGTWTTSVGGGVVTNVNSPTSSGSGLTFGANIFVWTITNATCPPSIDSVIISVISCEPSSILIPNVFTPNGDGENDFFTVDGVNLASVKGEIYNRWGQKMFAWDNVKGAWDGRTTAGVEVPDGTYFYIITALGNDGTEYFKKGTVSLIR
jgi:gliding motility-associated-like protein